MSQTSNISSSLSSEDDWMPLADSKNYFIPQINTSSSTNLGLIICLGSREEKLTMNSILTVYLVCKHLPIDHPVGHVEDIPGQLPRRLLVRVQDGLPGDTEAHQHHQHNDHKVQHVDHLSRKKTKRVCRCLRLGPGSFTRFIMLLSPKTSSVLH